jgi:hypothetical protein
LNLKTSTTVSHQRRLIGVVRLPGVINLCSGKYRVYAALDHEELSLLLGGIDLTRTRRKDWYRKTVPESEKV